MERDSAVMFNLHCTSSGHYCVSIVDRDDQNNANTETISATEERILAIIDIMKTDDKMRVLEKLHKQFLHVSADKLQRLK